MVVKNLVDFHLGPPEAKNTTKVQIKSPDDIPAYKYVQIAKVIMERVCPNEDIPPFVLTFMLRVFRVIHLDVARKYPYPETLLNEGETNTRILDALTSCRDQIPENITEYLKNETCPEAGYIGTLMTNDDTYMYGDNMTQMPEHLRFDPSSTDMALETVWKMMLFAHYYCSPNFTNALYHSEFEVKVEAFFNNPILLYRWYHPGPANTVFKTVLSAFNLKNYAASIDRCVTTAHAMSEYQGWLRRPSDALKWKPQFQSMDEAVLEATAPLHPETHHDLENHHGRKKRTYYFQNNIWDEKAYCLRNSKDVAVEVRSPSVIGCRNRPAWFQNTD